MEQFDNNEIFDDFKPAEEPAAFVNETIGNVIERELTEVEQFKEDFDEQLLMADNPKDNLTQIIIGYVQGCGDINHVNICSYKSKNGVALDGWSFSGDEDLTTIDLFLTIYEPTLKSKACLKCLYFTIIIFDLCRYLEYFSYLCTINQTE